MNYKGHIVMGIVLIAILFFLNNYFNLINFPSTLMFFIYMVPTIIIWSILPDVDIGTSKARTLVLILLGILMVYSAWNRSFIAVSIIGLMIIWVMFLKHRQGLPFGAHSVLAVFLLALPLFFLTDWKYGVVAFLAGFIHLIVDKFTSGSGWRWRWI